jgi:hypothetical protein
MDEECFKGGGEMIEYSIKLDNDFAEFLNPENAEKLHDKIVLFDVNDNEAARKIKYKEPFSNSDEPIKALYAFWVKRTTLDGMKDVKVSFKGPKLKQNAKDKENEYQVFNATWSIAESDKWIMLYGGKTTDLSSRLRNHLMLGTPIYLPEEDEYKETKPFLYKRNTTSQFRAGLARLLEDSKFWTGYELEFIKQHVYFSYLQMDCFQERFYHEDLLIGIGKPWFNLDSER